MVKRRAYVLPVLFVLLLVLIPIILTRAGVFPVDVAILVDVILVILLGCYILILQIVQHNQKTEVEEGNGLPPALIESMHYLAVEKAGALPYEYTAQKHHIRALYSMAAKIKPSAATQALVMEQAISKKITTLQAACDAVLSGSLDADLDKCIAELETALKQRKAQA